VKCGVILDIGKYFLFIVFRQYRRVIMKSFKLISLITILFYLLSCSPDSEENNENAIIPLKIGNKWTYQRIFYFDSIPMSNTNINTITKIDTLIIDSLNDSIIAYKFESIYNDSSTTDTGAEWYNIENEILYSYGYENAGIIFGLPRKRGNNTIYFKGKSFNSPIERTLFLLGYKQNYTTQCNSNTDITYDPVEVLHYPLEINNEWYYREEYPFPILKKVISKESITVEAGQFNCYKIKWFWDMDANGVWDDGIDGYEYISIDGYGLIKRIFYFDVINGIPNEKEKEVLELLQYSLNSR
jgi:hypothetical protein